MGTLVHLDERLPPGRAPAMFQAHAPDLRKLRDVCVGLREVWARTGPPPSLHARLDAALRRWVQDVDCVAVPYLEGDRWRVEFSAVSFGERYHYAFELPPVEGSRRTGLK